jgi:putative ABC transport system permease protein
VIRLAIRSMLRNRRRSFITLGAVGLGVAIVVFASGFALGFIHMMLQQMLESRLGAIQVHAKGYMDASEAAPLKLDIANADDVMKKIAAIPGVEAVAPRLRFGAIVSNGKTSSIVFGEGVDGARELAVCPGRMNDVDKNGGGTWLTPERPHGGVIGAELGKALEAKAGAVLTMSASGREGGVNALDLDVAAVSRGATSLFDSKRSIIVPLPAAQELLQMNGRVTEIAVRVRDLEDIPKVAAAMRAALGPDLEVSTWEEVVPFLRDAVNRLRIILGGVSGVLFFIVVFGVINTMLMNVYERTREIGTMLALGVRRRQILALFLAEASALGLAGGLLGALVGVVATAIVGAAGVSLTPPGGAIQQIVHPVPRVDIALVALVVATVGALVAAAYPARKASLMNPVDALRT